MASQIISPLITYFKNCYQADHGGRAVIDMLDDNIFLELLSSEDGLISNRKGEIGLKNIQEEDRIAEIMLGQTTQEIVIGSLCFSGVFEVEGRKRNICMPLFLQEVKITHNNSGYYLSINNPYRQINPALADILKPKEPQSDLFTWLSEKMPDGEIFKKEIRNIQYIFREYFTNVITEGLDRYPKMIEDIGGIVFADEGKFRLEPVMGICTVNKPESALGVLNELDRLGSLKAFSGAINDVFKGFFPEHKKQKNKSRNQQTAPHFIPANLSESQLGILNSIDEYTTNVVIGPPGTGKSFTLSAIALDAFNKGKSVLIASKTNEAVDVIADILKHEFEVPDVIVRAGRAGYLEEMQDRVFYLLDDFSSFEHRIEPRAASNEADTLRASRPPRLKNGFKQYIVNHRELNDFKSYINKLNNALANLQEKLRKKAKNELKRGKSVERSNLLDKWRINQFAKKLDEELPYWEEVRRLGEKIHKRNKAIKKNIVREFYARLLKFLRKNPDAFEKLYKGATVNEANKKELFFMQSNFENILKVLPIWLVNADDIHQVLPLWKGAFDLVIIDEASQCDIASSIPLLHRGKNVVVIGDPKQFRHISFLPRKKQEAIRKGLNLDKEYEYLLDYRGLSLLDLCTKSIKNEQQVHFLNEHYRSVPEIIHFSNEHFYDNEIHIMTRHPLVEEKKAIEVIQCHGKRVKAGYNREEAAKALELVKQIVLEEKGLSLKHKARIGILSPFRAQVNYIQKEIDKHLTDEEKWEHDLLVSTPYGFQGEEREIMILSFAVDEESSLGTLRYLDKADVFNVSITRARNRQILLLSITPEKLQDDLLLKKYLNSISTYHQAKEQLPKDKQTSRAKALDYIQKEQKDEFAHEVIQLLNEFGVDKIIQNYTLGGLGIDLLVLHNKRTIAIDLVGFPGQFEDSFQVANYKMLFRVDKEVLVLPYSRWVLQRELVVGKLKEVFG